MIIPVAGCCRMKILVGGNANSMGEKLMPPLVDLVVRLEDRARFVARQLGHDLGPLRPGAAGEHLAACGQCGALLIITPAHGIGVRGTACSVDCRTRRRLRLIPGTAAPTSSAG